MSRALTYEELENRVADLEQQLAELRGDAQVHRMRTALGLTGTEARILALLVAGKGRVLSKGSMWEQVFQDVATGEGPDPKIVDVYVCKIRRKLLVHGFAAGVETIWGDGYRCTPEAATRILALVEARQEAPALEPKTVAPTPKTPRERKAGLPPRCRQLVGLLTAANGATVSAEAICRGVGITDNTLRATVSRTRSLLREHPGCADSIIAVRGLGYRAAPGLRTWFNLTFPDDRKAAA